ncbi:ABC-three component system middle component 2 [Labrenzia sp. DG1229]|uniref:ABC-three component system middle component 2 n=1 Tax=Labrenzia sp. DG1229 TaxID=681847 RepID=UPI0004903104|nr:ABC-three component system middle component 2 [Labrenzia sp. DG1229]
MSDLKKMTPAPLDGHRLFNTPLECGFRLLFALDACRPSSADLQRLISYDYLLVHSGDIAGGPPSLHPPVPFRGSEWVVKRDLVRAGLGLVFARDLVAKVLTPKGIIFAGSELTSAFVELLQTNYAASLRARAEWLAGEFGGASDQELQDFMTEKVGQWGAEFDRISALQELEL